MRWSGTIELRGEATPELWRWFYSLGLQPIGMYGKTPRFPFWFVPTLAETVTL